MNNHKSVLKIDEVAALTWIYPTNVSVRQYQVDICRAALERNTLVCLPTGFGKTLIAAVLIYNFYRFYPTGKIVFMAPTRPLVFQQINACKVIMCLPESDIAHLEGSVSADKRFNIWNKSRIFFCTPQILANDLQSGNCGDPKRFVLVVFDEAHRATDNYAYSQVVC
jgi:ERCC4-related helicase